MVCQKLISLFQNAACDFDLKLTYIIAYWQGSANDSYTFSEALHKYNFPKLPANSYFLADADFRI